MVNIEVHQERTVEDGPVYRVKTTVLTAQGIDRNIFVFNTETQAFEHVAVTWDMDNYPADRDQAILDGDDYYRKSEANVTYGDNQTTAIDAAAYTLLRIDLLAQQYNLQEGEFLGAEDHIFTEDN